MNSIRFVQNIIDLFRGKKILDIKVADNLLWLNKKNTKKSLERLKSKVAQNTKIKVYFFVISETTFCAPVFEKMLENDIFDPYIVVIPNVAYGYENMFYQMDKTYNFLSKKYASLNLANGGGAK